MIFGASRPIVLTILNPAQGGGRFRVGTDYDARELTGLGGDRAVCVVGVSGMVAPGVVVALAGGMAGWRDSVAGEPTKGGQAACGRATSRARLRSERTNGMTRGSQAGPRRRNRFDQTSGVESSVLLWLRRILAVGALAVAALGASAGSALATSVVNPGTGTAPPGSQHLTTILSYLAWGVTATCVAGVLVVASKMALATRGHQGGGEHAGALGWVLVAAVVAGSASALVGALI